MSANKRNAHPLRIMNRMNVLALALSCAYPHTGAVAQEAAGSSTSKAPTSYAGITGDSRGLNPASAILPSGRPEVFRQQIGAVEYAANAKIAKIVVELDRDGIPADGQTPVKFTVRLLGRDGQPVQGTSFATIENTGGRIQLSKADTDELGPGRRDLDKATPGVQLKVENGVAEFALIAPAEPMDVRVRVTAGAEEATGSISFLPELREMVAVGLVEGIINLNNIAGSQLAQARNGDVFEQEIHDFSRSFSNGKGSYAARTAFFLKGVVKGEYLLTAAYDSDKQTQDRLMRDIQPDQFYPVYGDSSVKGFDARSVAKLYVRVDKDKNYLLFGDYDTGAGFAQMTGGGSTASLAMRQLGNYSRTVNGVRLHAEDKDYVGNLFASKDSLKQVVEEFAGRGVSGPYSVSNNSGVSNSEKVEVIVRNRNQPSQIISSTPLARFVDYSFEPFSGRILFTQPIPAADANLNPVSIRVTYEVDQGGEQFWLLGADGQLKLSKHVEVGGSYVKDENPLAPYQLSSANLGIRIADHTLLVLEAARTTSTVNTGTGVNSYITPALANRVGEVNGNAMRADLHHEGNAWDLRAFAAKSDAEFNNPAASFNGGRVEAGAKVAADVSETVRVYADMLHSEDKIVDGKRDGAQLGAQLKATDKLTLDVSVRKAREERSLSDGQITTPTPITAPLGSGVGSTSGSIVSNGGGGFYGNGSDTLNPVTGTSVLSSGSAFPVSGGEILPGSLDSTSVSLGVSYRLTDKLTVRGAVENSIEGDRYRRAAMGADYQLAERTRLYGRYETNTGLSSLYSLNPDTRSNVLVAGVDTSYMKGGQVFSEYRMRDAIAARDMQAASGIRNMWDIDEGLRASTSAERLTVFAGNGAQATALTGGIDYTANPLWRGAARLEWRRTDSTALAAGADTYLSTITLARKLDRDWTILGRNYLLYTDNKDKGDILQDRFQVGAAYRDNDTNLVNALAKYEYLIEKDESVDPRSLRKTHILSAHADYHPSRPWWFTSRAAAKMVKEDISGVRDNYSAFLLGGRFTYDISERWDIGASASVLYSPQGAARQWAQGVEAGYQVQTNLWVSAGYNWSGFYDRDLSASDYTRRGVYLRLRWKFDEDLFRGKNPDVNRALDRSL